MRRRQSKCVQNNKRYVFVKTVLIVLNINSQFSRSGKYLRGYYVYPERFMNGSVLYRVHYVCYTYQKIDHCYLRSYKVSASTVYRFDTDLDTLYNTAFSTRAF